MKLPHLVPAEHALSGHYTMHLPRMATEQTTSALLETLNTLAVALQVVAVDTLGPYGERVQIDHRCTTEHVCVDIAIEPSDRDIVRSDWNSFVGRAEMLFVVSVVPHWLEKVRLASAA